jgi:hypothetical protein
MTTLDHLIQNVRKLAAALDRNHAPTLASAASAQELQDVKKDIDGIEVDRKRESNGGLPIVEKLSS